MKDNIVSAVFDSHAEAERAVSGLRSAGVSDKAISIIAKHDGKTSHTHADGEDAASFASQTALGAGAGALLGIAALAIPGVGPLVAAGAIAESAIGGAALTGTALGAAAGGLGNLLGRHGVSEEDQGYYSDRIEGGGVFVSVDTDSAGVSRAQAEDILYRAGGHNSRQARGTYSSTMSSSTGTTTY